MLDANATHISLTLEGISVDLQVLSFVGREALNQPFCFDIELVSARPDLKLEELLHKRDCLTFGATAATTNSRKAKAIIADYICAVEFGWGKDWDGHDKGADGKWLEGVPSASKTGKLSKGGSPKARHVLYKLTDGANGTGILKTAEGAYRLQLDDQGFTMIRPKGIKSGLAWGQIVRVREKPDFYWVACAELDRKGKAYVIPKHSNAMDAELYQQGLKLFLSRVPNSAAF
ncbi:hypothetical protein SAMN04490194_3189 [Pseudomonas migulae]|uniref:Uncharacterized protein n=1 Tax=Pseudomonas migulae TaxID=78543 RepID=A0A1H5KHA7_9PSED|nr:YcxB family protein [Pseudomonas migulae]SEE63491.1 hypothetical protein SAMN04490194_3189 [Pseudomonas migulae]